MHTGELKIYAMLNLVHLQGMAEAASCSCSGSLFLLHFPSHTRTWANKASCSNTCLQLSQFDTLFAAQNANDLESGLQDHARLRCDVAIPRLGDKADSATSANDTVVVDWRLMQQNFPQQYEGIKKLLSKWGARSRTSERVGSLPTDEEASQLILNARDACGNKLEIDETTREVTMCANSQQAQRIPVVWRKFEHEGKVWRLAVDDHHEPIRLAPGGQWAFPHKTHLQTLQDWVSHVGYDLSASASEINENAKEQMRQSDVPNRLIPHNSRMQIPVVLPDDAPVQHAIRKENDTLMNMRRKAERLRTKISVAAANRRQLMEGRVTGTQIGEVATTIGDVFTVGPASQSFRDTELKTSTEKYSITDVALVRTDEAVGQLQNELRKLEANARRLGHDLDALTNPQETALTIRRSVDVDFIESSTSVIDGLESFDWMQDKEQFEKGKSVIVKYMAAYYPWLDVKTYTEEYFKTTIVPWLARAKKKGYRVPVLNPPNFPQIDAVYPAIERTHLMLDPSEKGPPPKGRQMPRHWIYGKPSAGVANQSGKAITRHPFVSGKQVQNVVGQGGLVTKLVEKSRGSSPYAVLNQEDTFLVTEYKQSNSSKEAISESVETLETITSIRTNGVSDAERDRMYVSAATNALFSSRFPQAGSPNYMKEYGEQYGELTLDTEDQYIKIDKFGDGRVPDQGFRGTLTRLNAEPPSVVRRVRDFIMKNDRNAKDWGMAYYEASGERRRWMLVRTNAPPAGVRKSPIELFHDQANEDMTDEQLTMWTRDVVLRKNNPAFQSLESDTESSDEESLADLLQDESSSEDEDESSFEDEDEGESDFDFVFDDAEVMNTSAGAFTGSRFDTGCILSPLDDEGRPIRPLCLPVV